MVPSAPCERCCSGSLTTAPGSIRAPALQLQMRACDLTLHPNLEPVKSLSCRHQKIDLRHVKNDLRQVRSSLKLARNKGSLKGSGFGVSSIELLITASGVG